LSRRFFIPRYFGLDGIDQGPQPESSAEPKKSKIVHIHLKGPSIREAWLNHEQQIVEGTRWTLKDLEIRTEPKYYTTSLEVFHGMDDELNSPLWCESWNNAFFTLDVARKPVDFKY
jgi:hypothetical protein